ncbi:hypothetical protein BCF55_1893 [Hydrogenivirga caldilitoris]|uniref:Uncharacterized protein n=1 Tax=Hydrogenivirga caldilitoris TaxID=246264 RepID=A0A497XRD0_9AQUI|nr:hypothetical protein [Hydrogenivirga caldilitoris]RLJ71587.1 hypothetical protein BCF55_1893 [Hydrogenivirga caldilitoris]
MKLKGHKLINVFEIDGQYIVGVYEGSLSEYDILIKYRQKNHNGGWSRIRTPKHIHWAVDILMKMQANPEKTRELISFLLGRWKDIKPIKSEEDRKLRTGVNHLEKTYREELNKYAELSEKGEYSVKFLIFIAELLMTQEKTNRDDAYMFEKLLKALEEGEDIFNIVSIATHRGR